MLPTIVLAGSAFALAYGPLNIAATNGIAPEEQGLAGGLVNTSFQIGGALFLAVVVAVNDANAGADGSPQALLDGFHAALVVPVIAAALGAAATAAGLFRRAAPAKTPEVVPATAPSPSTVVRGLTSATIWSEDHNNLLPFYRDVLGLRVAHQAPGRVTLGNGIGPSLRLGTHSDVKGKSSDPYRYQVALGSDDLDADLLRLQAAGVEFFDGDNLSDGIRLVTVKDPDGNLIQLQDGGERNEVVSAPS
jgi:predicted enzyme related to lactoylglutathione lyase